MEAAIFLDNVSTHSRLKAAGIMPTKERLMTPVSTHSRLKAAGSGEFGGYWPFWVSTHSRLKAAGFWPTHPEEQARFQHTAA